MSSDVDPSGAATAAAAHEAGAVRPVQELPLTDVELHFVVHGDEQTAGHLCRKLGEHLIEQGAVSAPVDYTIRERP